MLYCLPLVLLCNWHSHVVSHTSACVHTFVSWSFRWTFVSVCKHCGLTSSLLISLLSALQFPTNANFVSQLNHCPLRTLLNTSSCIYSCLISTTNQVAATTAESWSQWIRLLAFRSHGILATRDTCIPRDTSVITRMYVDLKGYSKPVSRKLRFYSAKQQPSLKRLKGPKC